MKDKRLEQEFDEYFKGVSTPNDITADAKRYVKPKNSFMPRFLKFASVAASCILVVTLAVIAVTNRFQPPAPPTNEGNSAPDGSAGVSIPLYYENELTAVEADAYSLPDNSCFKFITKLAYAGNASVSNCVTYYSGEKLVLFNAEVNMLNALTRYDTNVYIEFEKDKVYAPLKDYSEGEKKSYRGAEYYVTQTTADNGEPQFKLCVSYKGVKYYFDIISTDTQAYLKYLEIVVNNY